MNHRALVRTCHCSVVTVDDGSMWFSGAAHTRTQESITWDGVGVIQRSYCITYVPVHCITNDRTQFLVHLNSKSLVICFNLHHCSNVVAVGVHQADLPRIITRKSVGDAVATHLDWPA